MSKWPVTWLGHWLAEPPYPGRAVILTFDTVLELKGDETLHVFWDEDIPTRVVGPTGEIPFTYRPA